MAVSVICLEFDQSTGNLYADSTYYDQASNSCDMGLTDDSNYLTVSTSDFDLMNDGSYSVTTCLDYNGSQYVINSAAMSSSTCTSDYALLQQSTLVPMQTAYLASLPPDTNTTFQPDPIDIVEAFAAGFFIALPIFLTILGGRLVLKSIFLSK